MSGIDFAMAWHGMQDTGAYLLMGNLLCATYVPDAWRRIRDRDSEARLPRRGSQLPNSCTGS